jgi:hypothetical protein
MRGKKWKEIQENKKWGKMLNTKWRVNDKEEDPEPYGLIKLERIIEMRGGDWKEI